MQTNPKDIPVDVAVKLLLIREALLHEDFNEAYHQLYLIADPECASFTPWAVLEEKAKTYGHTPDQK